MTIKTRVMTTCAEQKYRAQLYKCSPPVSLQTIELGSKRVGHINANQLPVRLTLINHGHHTQDLHLFHLTHGCHCRREWGDIVKREREREWEKGREKKERETERERERERERKRVREWERKKERKRKHKKQKPAYYLKQLPHIKHPKEIFVKSPFSLRSQMSTGSLSPLAFVCLSTRLGFSQVYRKSCVVHIGAYTSTHLHTYTYPHIHKLTSRHRPGEQHHSSRCTHGGGSSCAQNEEHPSSHLAGWG